MKKAETRRTKMTKTLTAGQVSRAMRVGREALGVVRTTGALNQTTAGATRYTTYVLPALALLQDLAGAVARGEVTEAEAGEGVGALMFSAFRLWDVVLAGARAGTLRYMARNGEVLEFFGTRRAAAALRRIAA